MNAATQPLRRARGFLTVFLKEVRENLRDRRTLTSAFLTGPLLTPLLFVMLVNISINQQLDKADKPLAVPLIGAQYAPNLVDALKAGGIVPQPAVADPEEAVRRQDADLVLRIAPGYAKAWRKGEPVQVEVIYDSSQRGADTPVERVTKLLETYSRQQGAMRLVARGLSPAVAVPVQVAKRDQATAQSRAVLMFNMLPYLFVLTIFIGGMYLAIDLTAGERERQSLEPLFANPVPRWKIFLGKLAAICAFSAASLVICLLAFGVIGGFVPTEKLGMEIDLGPGFALRVLLLQLPMIVLLAALQSMVAAFAKSYREAQTYLSFLMMLPLLPSIMLMMLPFKPQGWMYAVPLLGQHLGILDLVRGNGLSPQSLAMCLGGTALAALLAAGATVQLYRSERLAISA
ncbi:ABC transporter permease [Fulvimonas soli]|jgi:sodium transport system permease protein|uniref:Sodium transport system permease protein n=1 Tax=Fulvimonas soli TaxID=155197 RepID=A0A316I0U5_9GAMM|nr:ABC transporter permease [Fulvimonas soli]PWK86731.1 sodium transport system permease protein [Fulvimonas soli]TNY27064.1 ABC transporter permease [Fulvimonas soli]